MVGLAAKTAFGRGAGLLAAGVYATHPLTMVYDVMVLPDVLAVTTLSAATWLFFVAAVVVAYWNLGANGSVSVDSLPVALVGGVVVFQVVLVLSSFIQEKMGSLHGR